MSSKNPPPRTMLGAIIRYQRERAELTMRQLSETVGISNPYLSQIERGLRAPSENVLTAIAESLQTSTEELYSAAGYRPRRAGGPKADPLPMEAAIDAASELTSAQRSALREVYRSFLDANTLRPSPKP